MCRTMAANHRGRRFVWREEAEYAQQIRGICILQIDPGSLFLRDSRIWAAMAARLYLQYVLQDRNVVADAAGHHE